MKLELEIKKVFLKLIYTKPVETINVSSICDELNIKRQIAIAIFVVAMGIIFKIPKIEFMFLIFSIALVIIAETINTAIETVVDMYTDKYNEKAKIAKDVGAGAVLVCSINSVVIAIIVFAERILALI